MRRTHRLSALLRGLIHLVEEEAERNAAFAERLESLLDRPPQKAVGSRTQVTPARPGGPVPDVLAALESKGAEEFRFWLRAMDLSTLRAIVRANGFDAAKASRRWSTPDKFIDLIAQQTQARLRRGSAFLPPRADQKAPHDGGGTPPQ